MYPLYSLILATLISAIAIPVVKRIAVRYGYINHPVVTRWHQQRIVPTMGGVAIWISFTATIMLSGYWTSFTLALLFSTLFLQFTGLYDDKHNLNPVTKLIFQAAIALAFVIVPYSSNYCFPSITPAISVGVLVLYSNAYNIFDNIDGAAAGCATITCLGYGFLYHWQGNISGSFIVLSLAGGCLGFLFYNFKPASIFMGNCGSQFLGFTIAAVGLHSSQQSLTYTGIIGILFMSSVPVIDLLFVTVTRIKRKQAPWIGGIDHISHRLSRSGLGDVGAVIILYSMSILGVIVGFMLLNYSSKY